MRFCTLKAYTCVSNKDRQNPMQPLTAKNHYRPEIDGIRAFAVIAVIINHFNKNILPSGFLGVDIFFVISGFVITASLANRPSRGLRDFLMDFYTRRIKRLVPALLFFVIISSIFICLFNPNPGSSLKTGIFSLFGLSNLYLLQQSTNYFSPITDLNIFIHTWSLGVEEQFYLIFPVLAWITGFSRRSSKGARNLFISMGVISIASLLAFIYFYLAMQPIAYFSMPTRFWEISAGCLLFLHLNNSPPNIIKPIPPLPVIISIIAILFVPYQFATISTVAIVILTSILIVSLRPKTMIYSLLTQRAVVYIGLISYSLYLWHWSILTISRWTIGISWWSVPFQIIIIFLFAIISYRYIETPLRYSNWSDVRWHSIGYGIVASSISAAILLGFARPLRNVLKQASRIINPSKYERPGVVNSKLYCHNPKQTDSAFNDCLKPLDKEKKIIYLIGDSHASNHFQVVLAL